MEYKYLLINLFLFLLITIGFNNKKKIENFVNNEKRYRLADMIRFKNQRENKKWGYEYHLKNFPDSIATEYMKKTKKNNNLKLINKIIKKKQNENHLKYKDYIILHLRTGDVIENKKYNNNKSGNYFLKNKVNKYVYPLSYYKKVIEKLKKDTNNKNILLITGFHNNLNHNESYKYISGIEKYFIKNGFNIKKRINNDPDDDFIIMCNSKYFIKGGGGFSKLITEIIKLNNH